MSEVKRLFRFKSIAEAVTKAVNETASNTAVKEVGERPKRKEKGVLTLLIWLFLVLLPASSSAGQVSKFVDYYDSPSVKSFCQSLGVSKKVIEAVKIVESGSYDYVVRINEPVLITGIEKVGIKRKGSVYYCKDKKVCVAFIRFLISKGVKNFDSGPLQINYLHNGKYFYDYPTAVFSAAAIKFACWLIHKGFRKYGYNAYGVAYYHSGSSLHNRRYARAFYRVYQKITAGN